MGIVQGGGQPLNRLIAILHPYKLGYDPPLPEVRAGWEPFMVAVNWAGNKGKWLSVTVGSFKDAEGNAIETDPAEVTILQSEGAKVKTINFVNYVSDVTVCKFDVVYADASPDSLTVDPIVILKP